MPSKPRTAKKAAAKLEFRTWDAYVAEAQHPPFELMVSADETLDITCPDGAASRSITIAQRTADYDLLLTSLFGDHAERVGELAAAAPATAFPELVLDVLVHFGLAERRPNDDDDEEEDTVSGGASASSS